MAWDILFCLEPGVLLGPADTIKEEHGHSVHAAVA